MQRKLKILIRFLAEYALDEEIINGSRFYELQNVKTEAADKSEKHYPFSQTELDILWENSKDRYIQAILMGIYSGVRPGELAKLKKLMFNSIRIASGFTKERMPMQGELFQYTKNEEIL